ncbi:hypothetical protein TSH58p_01140 (plasmid) [Azospirillum sp. TSH58]|uniref:hypothetical protein n=1 Tax=Azospirillum sp. TSH58 TaxID=664962 RepID=UPI000D5FE2D2|nr:hypothetical protein [Azospirillum sp. TSH58]AWJ82176.1 hypothetical protein TSH58p_01140 [Azospirillum sp. TSH58]PWC70996.1 hypothetical protein TSH58_12085 [Azospirillum sp. TSH58]
MTGKSDKDQDQPRGEKSVLGSEQDFKKDQPQDAGRDERAKDDIGRMGEASRENRSTKDMG